jgi:tetratricopeptide repeat protein 8
MMQIFRYNIGHIGTALGDLGLAYQAFKVAVSVDPTHGEALNNIAVLEMRRQKFDLARSCLDTSMDVSPHLFEPLYNIGKKVRVRNRGRVNREIWWMIAL